MFINNIDPALIRIGSLQIRYYGLMYLIGFTLAYFFLSKLAAKHKIPLQKEQVLDYLLYLAAGAIIGARVFYVIVYNPLYFFQFQNFWKIGLFWTGGLSFHGGLIGASIAGIIFCRKYNLDTLRVADITALPLALALFFGRIGNFLNSELVGRVTDVPWCVKFRNYAGCRHPSQLYEALKNMVIFAFLWVLKDAKLKKGTLFGIFITMYSALRFVIEFFRQADSQLGYFYGFTMGQIINTGMFIFGILFLYWVNKQK
jgi:phosphatidylglycerol---prolipoprotein diacylglyceryl transferase